MANGSLILNKKIVQSFWLFGLSVGLSVAILVTAVFTVWNWLENPGGIFRDASGTNWGFVYDTASSWFLPTLMPVAVASSMLHLVAGKMLTKSGSKRLRDEGSDGIQ